MLQVKVDEISKIYPFKKFEYVYSDGQVKSVIIDIDDFLSLMETPDLMQSIENGLKDFREGKLLRENEVADGKIESFMKEGYSATKADRAKLNADWQAIDTEDLLARIEVNQKVLVGKPTIRGLRISVEQILRALANNVTVEDLLEDYPELEHEDIQATLMYATELVAEQQVFPVAV